MLKITRCRGESVYIDLAEGLDPSAPVGDLLDKPVEFRIIHFRGSQAFVAVDANPGLRITRNAPKPREDAPELLVGHGLR